MLNGFKIPACDKKAGFLMEIKIPLGYYIDGGITMPIYNV